MFRIFGSGGVECQQCAHKNDDAATYCEKCGAKCGAERTLSSDDTRREPVLNGQRWLPDGDALAVYFRVSELNGVLSKTLQVAQGTRAFLLRDSNFLELAAGEHEIGGSFRLLHGLAGGQSADILIIRQAPLPVEFAFEDIHSAEFLRIAARFSIQIRIGSVQAFVQHFTATPGRVTGSQLHDLLAASVRRLAAEFIGAQSIREMAGNPLLQQQLEERLQASLKMQLPEYGLDVTQVQMLALRHDKFNANREKIGSAWLVREDKRAHLDHARQLDELYSVAEWQVIAREQAQIRLRSERQEMRRQEGKGQHESQLQGERDNLEQRFNLAQLGQDAEERMQGIRARQIELYGRIIESGSRQEAIKRGAAEALKDLEHALSKKSGQRHEESVHWLHVRTLAQIKMRTEWEISQLEARESLQLVRQRMAHRLHQQHLQNEMVLAQSIDSEKERVGRVDCLRRNQDDLDRRERELAEEEQRTRVLNLGLVTEARAREFQRLQDWEDELQLQRKRALLRAEGLQEGDNQVRLAELKEKLDIVRRTGAHADEIAQHEKLIRTVEAKGVYESQQLRLLNQGRLDELAQEESRLKHKQQEEDARWQRELQKYALERDQTFARIKAEHEKMLAEQSHAAALARIAIERIGAIGGLSDTGKVAVVETPNALALADILKMQTQAAMSAEQILASQAGQSAHAAQAFGAAAAAPESNVTPAQAAAMAEQRVRDERELRAHDADKERRHLLDLLNVQNAAYGQALAANMKLGVGVAQSRAETMPAMFAPPAPAPSNPHCSQGHPSQAGQKFCAECGLPLH